MQASMSARPRVLAIAMITFGLFAYVHGRVDTSAYLQLFYLPGAGELTVYCAALVGACIGFLWYNAFPATIFMGDGGSLFLGFALAAIGIAVDLEHVRHVSHPRSDGATTLAQDTAGFILGMILLSRRVGFDPINTRYLSPAYPPLLVLIAAFVAKVLAGERRRRPRHAERNLLITALVLLAVPQVASTAHLIARAGHEERGLTGPYWTSSAWDDASWDADPGLRRAQMLAGDGALIISNVWDLIGIRTGFATKALPELAWPGFPERSPGPPRTAFVSSTCAVSDPASI